MQRKMISLLGAAGLMAMSAMAAVSQGNGTGDGAPRAGQDGGRGPGMGGPRQGGQGMGGPRGSRGLGVGGEVTEVDANAGTISVASRWDETQTIKIGAGAKILARKDTTVGGLKVGDTIQVNGVFSQLTAASIESGDLESLPPPPMGGGRPGMGGPGGQGGGQNGRRGRGAMNGQRGPGGQGGPDGLDSRRGPGGGGPNDFGGGPMGGPGGPGGPDETGGPEGAGDDGPPPPDAMRPSSANSEDVPHIRGRRVADSARNIAATGNRHRTRPADLEQENQPGGPDNFDGAGAPPPPPPGGADDEMGGRPRGHGAMGGGPRGGGMMGGHAHLSGKITSLSPLTISVSDSVSLVIKTDAKTHVTKIVTEPISDIKKGDRVFAMGAFSKDVLDAQSVSVNLEP